MFHILDKRPLIKRLYTLLSPEIENFLIFGSAAISEEFNDIDILITPEKNIKKTIKDFEATYSVKIHAINKEKKHLTKTLLKEIRKQHIILKGHDFFVRLMYNELGMV